MDRPTVIRKGDGELLFDAGQLSALAGGELKFRDVAVNNSSLAPGGQLPLGAHDDKLEVVTPVALGDVQGPVVRYTDDAGGYDLELCSYDSIVIPRGMAHAAYNLCDCTVALMIANFDYLD
jgi:hypothetical protein